MGVIKLPSTLLGGLTPICNDCGITAEYDIEEEYYHKHQRVWDNWRCPECREPVFIKVLRER
jgi:hypothetical protein